MNKKQLLMDKNSTQYPNIPNLAITTTNLFFTSYTGEKKICKISSINNYKEIKVIKKVKNTSFNEPIIFNKKKKESSIKTIRYINNDTGKTRHFTPVAQEWFNSIYTYNKNYIKSLPTADKKVLKLLKSYFNFFVNNKKLKTKRIANRYRKLSSNKVFVGKGDLKHTNEKVIITSYIYNAEQLYLKSWTIRLAEILFSPKKKLKKYILIDTINWKEVIVYNRHHTLKEFLNYPDHPTRDINFPDHPTWHKNVCFRLFWKKYLKLIGHNKLVKEEKAAKKKLNGKKKKNYISIKDKAKSTFLQSFSVNKDPNNICENFFGHPLLQLVENKENTEKLLKFENDISSIKNLYDNFDRYMAIAKDSYEKIFRRFAYLLMINNVKFEKPFIRKLAYLVKNIYNKEVEFNLVNLYKMHLNSDIYTQSVSLKLRNRDNKLFKVLTRSLTKAKLPNVSRLSEKFYKDNKDEYLINKIRNSYINSMFSNNTSVDPLNSLLLGFFPSTNNLKIEVKKKSSIIKRSVSLYKYILRTLKHVKLAGVRVEAKGRLTRRFTAARSVFKVKWKGGLKNVDSSFKGLSAIMLRGDRKSNVEYSIVNSKNRNGAFGVKGWIGTK
jgi:hypothetical protein